MMCIHLIYSAYEGTKIRIYVKIECHFNTGARITQTKLKIGPQTYAARNPVSSGSVRLAFSYSFYFIFLAQSINIILICFDVSDIYAVIGRRFILRQLVHYPICFVFYAYPGICPKFELVIYT